MNRVCVGVSVHAEPERLLATLASVRTNTSRPFDLLLLADAPDAATQGVLSTLREVPQSGTAMRLGTPACFNRLIAANDADVMVLLESGALVAPGWLDHLLAALAADPGNGLAGPSTNRAWNAQGVFPGGLGTEADIARVAAEAAGRFGTAAQTLEPLYSLADFCYVVRREVVEAVGAADEGYGLGPCWEMDYNLRAARAGFRGVWVGASYVYRSPLTTRHRHEERLCFEASKQRYQDKFCALRLRGERSDYELHCRGEECEHFAPPARIQIHIPLPAPTPLSLPQPSAAAGAGAAPLVTCIMPTRNRTEFVLQSIRYFSRQEYPARELIILDDGGDSLAGRVPEDPWIRYVRQTPGQSIGAKRNLACELARGDIIAQWDDDDWYGPGRLGAQVAPLLADQADISGLTTGIFFDLPNWEFWACSPSLHRRLFVADVHGGTLVYHRRVWEQLARYPDMSLAEDAAFLRQALSRGARLCRVLNEGVYMYLRHGSNSWSFRCGEHVDPKGWQRIAEPPMTSDDRTFYAAQSSSLRNPLMPTGGLG